jgi:hypothetical protein
LPPPRRQSPTPPRPRRELPVLFHLLDVSQPPGFAGARPAELAPESQAKFDHPISAPADESFQASAIDSVTEAFDLATAAGLAETSGLASMLTEPLTGTTRPAPGDELIESKPDEPSSIEEPLSNTAENPTDAAPAAERSGANSDEAVTLRQRAHERRQKRQKSPGKDDWFSTQGKFILIGFLVALVATIYIARTNRNSAEPPVARQPAHQRRAAASKLATESPAPPPAKQSDANLPRSSGPATSITSVRPAETSPAGESRTALHPPTIPQLAQEPAASSPADDSLFPWARPEEPRTATAGDDLRSADLRSATVAPSPAPSTSPPLSTQPPTLPSHQPQYPSTAYPGDYRSPAPPALPSAPAFGPAASQPSYPTTNSASGYRYERTGSGFH